jgi:act minimal PKS acyl carrier protein
MAHREVTIEELMRILYAAAGTHDGTPGDGDMLDVEFADLGYDSLALLEAGNRIEREYAVKLQDDAITSARTPRALLAIVNRSVRRVT